MSRALYEQKTRPVELTDGDFKMLIGACDKLALLHQDARIQTSIDDLVRHHTTRIREYRGLASRLTMARNGKDWRYKEVRGLED